MSKPIIKVNESFAYSKKDLKWRLEELYKLALNFTATQDKGTFITLIRDICTDDFYARFKIDFWRDVVERDTRLHDLLELAAIWFQIKTFCQESSQEMVTFEMGAAVMNDQAKLVEKLCAHKYEKED